MKLKILPHLARFFCYGSLFIILGLVFTLRFGFSPTHRQQAGLIWIQKGTGLTQIAKSLAQEGFVTSAYGFLFLSALKQVGSKIKAGEYEIAANATPHEILNDLVKGNSYKRKFLVREGESLRQVYADLAQCAYLTDDLPKDVPEGVLMPETYYYERGDQRRDLVKRMHQSMQKMLNEAWVKRAADVALKTPLEALILASLIEKETHVAAERPHVASVFYNRLKLGMPLQACPSVIYAITKGETSLGRPLTTSDLAFVSPYNTYLNRGLPPTPICNPGKASLLAVLNPVESKDLYFVVDGNGGHHFSKTLVEHNAMKAQAKKNGAL